VKISLRYAEAFGIKLRHLHISLTPQAVIAILSAILASM
jgi:hypothetical protein